MAATRSVSSIAFALLLLSACGGGSRPPGDVDGGDAGFDAGPPQPDAGTDAGFDAGPVPRVGLCEACVVHEQCGPLARCIPLTDGSFACLAICEPDIPSCRPEDAFECVFRPASPDFHVCAPIGALCCVDEDADGYGVGAGCEGPDCDDEDMLRNPGVDETCNGGDDDCDDAVDEMAGDCLGQDCRSAGMAYEEAPPASCVDASCMDPGATSCVLYSCDLGADEGDRCATTCLRGGLDADGLCITAAHCDLGACAADVDDGGECDEDSDCVSDHCDNGFCCSDGTCCGVAADCPGSGGLGVTCDDSATCQGTRGELTCADFVCGTRSGVPDDSACDESVVASDCGYFLSVTCTGEVDQPPPRCPTTCGRDDECDGDAHCDAVCLPDLPDGDVCDEDGDCISAHCDDNVCCSGGDCCRTPGDCEASYSSAPVCDIPSACQGSRDAATCTSFRCGTAMDVDDDSGCTASVEALTCGLYPSRFCTGGSEQPAPVCAMMCTSDGECDDVAHCDAPMCFGDLPDGSACDENSDCIGGHCQNGFCCASGDCCSRASDCSVADYGEPSRCLAASTCQGERRDPVCNVTFQCTIGPPIGDDSGCAGLLASDCGLYPSIFCSSMMSQPPDPASRCAMMCTTSADCDPGAFCMGGMCRPRGMVGDACTATAECGSGLSCVDGVCCTSSCTGGCMACNVAGSLGTCAPVPDRTDPAAECGMLSCLAYYAGWAGDRCFHRADAPASAVFCNGAGACQTAATVCPTTGFGTLQIDCDDDCQTRNLATCSGMTPGSCTNDPPGSQSCGTGACRRTTAQCNMGTPVMCVPGTPAPEMCNDVDDNCNGPIDEGLSGDGYESNDSCSEASPLGRIYTQAASGRSTSVTVSPTLYAGGDVDVFRVDWSENDSTCGCGVSTDEDYGLTASLEVPPGAGSYRVCGHMNGTCATGTTCVTVLAGDTASITIWKDGCCSPFGCGDSGTGWFTVSGVGPPAFECLNYTLDIDTVIGCR